MIASESGHYYTKDGTPAYTVIGKNGKERNTTIRDCRELGLVPSVTEVLKVIAKPGLEKWKQTSLLQSALTLPRIDGESLDEYAKRVILDSQEQGKAAMEKGTLIHGQLEKFFSGESILEEYGKLCNIVMLKMHTELGTNHWLAEKSFACDAGFGGKCDLHSAKWVVDFKTKEFKGKTPDTYDEHHMQLAAYRYGLGLFHARCAIVFVSTDSDDVHIVEVSHEELTRGLDMFLSALSFWKASKKYEA